MINPRAEPYSGFGANLTFHCCVPLSCVSEDQGLQTITLLACSGKPSTSPALRVDLLLSTKINNIHPHFCISICICTSYNNIYIFFLIFFFLYCVVVHPALPEIKFCCCKKKVHIHKAVLRHIALCVKYPRCVHNATVGVKASHYVQGQGWRKSFPLGITELISVLRHCLHNPAIVQFVGAFPVPALTNRWRCSIVGTIFSNLYGMYLLWLRLCGQEI